MKLQEMSNKDLVMRYRAESWVSGNNDTEIESKYEAELLSRLERDEGERDAIKWANIAGTHQHQIEILADEIENSKCCGNCKLHLETCPKEWNPYNANTELIPSWGYCEQWQSDKLTRKEREG